MMQFRSIDPELLLTPLALSRSVRGCFRLQQARFPDFRLRRVGFTAFPISREISDLWLEATHCRYTVAGTVWAFHPTSLVTLMGTCDGPIRLGWRIGIAIYYSCKELNAVFEPRHSMSGHMLLSRDLQLALP